MSETVSELLKAGEKIREINLLFIRKPDPSDPERPIFPVANLILIRKKRNADCFPLHRGVWLPGLTATLWQ